MKPFNYTVSFRIEHPDLDPNEISTRLTLTPDTSWMAGSVRRTPTDRTLEGCHKITYWSYTLEHVPDIDLADQLQDFTCTLEPHKGFLNDLRASGGKCEYFIGWFANANSGEIFSYQLLRKLGNLEIDLALDIYGE